MNQSARFCGMHIIHTAVPHKYKKTSPTAEDVIAQMESVLAFWQNARNLNQVKREVK